MEWRKHNNHISSWNFPPWSYFVDWICRRETMGYFFSEKKRPSNGRDHWMPLNRTRIKNKILFELSIIMQLLHWNRQLTRNYELFKLELFPFIIIIPICLIFFPISFFCETVGNKITSSVRRRKKVKIYQIIMRPCVYYL